MLVDLMGFGWTKLMLCNINILYKYNINRTQCTVNSKLKKYTFGKTEVAHTMTQKYLSVYWPYNRFWNINNNFK